MNQLYSPKFSNCDYLSNNSIQKDWYCQLEKNDKSWKDTLGFIGIFVLSIGSIVGISYIAVNLGIEF